ncbi:hypothetical protein F5X68DRAFT_201855 [Plectosphaerella plurivora]|uniref:Uncharacterized protein n=1 Tax=Plectosphaerella plurivora TaxID=936078 RepID=A0A9P9AF89_9PEZI|nr:hypothetical protein F5X68DRAFT_201855 [Plectosphaerella plurivora]
MVRLAPYMVMMAAITTQVVAWRGLGIRHISIPGFSGLKQDFSDPSSPDWSCGEDEIDLKPQDCVMAAGDMFDSFVGLPNGTLTVRAGSCKQYVRGGCQATVCNVGQDVQEVDIRATAMKVMNPLVTRCVVSQKRGQWQDGKGILVDVRRSEQQTPGRSSERL